MPPFYHTTPRTWNEIIPSWQTQTPELAATALALLGELHRPEPPSQLYIDALTNVLALQLLRHHSTRPTHLTTYPGGLPQHQLLTVLDYIDAHLGEPIKLATLAQLTGISPFHFGRLFKQSMGCSPHQYVMRQRIERAKQRLHSTDDPIVTIALACGFSSHSHLSQVFRQATGLTPRAYRLQR